MRWPSGIHLLPPLISCDSRDYVPVERAGFRRRRSASSSSVCVRADGRPITTHLPSGENAPGLPLVAEQNRGRPVGRAECSRGLSLRRAFRPPSPNASIFPSSDSASGTGPVLPRQIAFTRGVDVHEAHVRAIRVVGQERTSVCRDVQNADGPHGAMHDALATVEASWRERRNGRRCPPP